KRQPDSPPALLGGETRLEHPPSQVARNSWSVVRDAHHYAAVLGALRGQSNAAATAGERIDRVLRQDLHCPLEQDRIAADRRKIRGDAGLDDDRIGKRRPARAKVARGALDDVRDVD